MAQFYLPKHLYLCVTKECVILLDLKEDEYTAIGRTEARALGASVHGWPIAGSDSSSSALELNSITMQMKGKGLLTEDPAAGKVAATTTVSPAQASLGTHDVDRPPAVGLVDVAKFFGACLVAAFELRWLSLERVIGRVRTRASKSTSLEVDIQRARELLGIFYRLRPLFYTARGNCLFDSLVLIKFLFSYRLYPQWVFGVKMGPFAAHSWVQGGGFVFNATLERAREFTPILVV